MFNQRRKHSAYLEYDDGKIKSKEPNSKKEKVKQVINSHKKADNFSRKNLLYLGLFFILTISFILFIRSTIDYISLQMTNTKSNYEVSKNIETTTKNINIKERKKIEINTENMDLLISNINSYNKEISSIYGTLKGYISIYYNGKESIYMTQKSLDGMVDRIKLDKNVIKKDEVLKNYPELQNDYIKRLNNISIFLNTEIVSKETTLDNLNDTIRTENNLYNQSKTRLSNILKDNNLNYTIKDNQFKIKK